MICIRSLKMILFSLFCVLISASSLETAWQQHRRKFNGQLGVVIMQSDESDSKVDCSANLRAHASLALPSVPIPEFKNVFAGACSRVRDFAVQLRVKVAQRVVWGGAHSKVAVSNVFFLL